MQAPSSKKGAFTAKWKKATGATGYVVQFSKNKNFKGIADKKVITKAGTVSYSTKKLKKGTKYYVRVRSYAGANKDATSSAWSTYSKAVLCK